MLVYCYIRHREFCVHLCWCTVLYIEGNCGYSRAGVLLYAAQGILCTAVLVYCYIQYRELCVQQYWCTVIYRTGNCVYRFTDVVLYTAQ